MADIRTEREMSRAEVAEYLHEFAEKLGGTGHGVDREHHSEGHDETTEFGKETDPGGTAADGTDAGTDTQREEGEQKDGRVTFTLGNDSATVNPPETIHFEVAVDSTAGMLESSAHETVEFTLQWDAEETDDDGEFGLH